MKTLTDRKIAEQERVTSETQRQAQEVKQQLEQATALAATQAKVVDAERQVAIPDIVAGGSNGGGTLVDVLLANVIRDGRSQRELANTGG